MQLVLSNNRVLAHGENFISMGGTVINTETNKVYQNATVAECDGCPSDIDTVGYEYHAGVFVPCAPYGKGNGNIMVACQEDCGTPKDSGIPLDYIFTSSYMAFVASVNSDTLDAAFGKNNEDLIFSIGRQMAMYAWFKGTDKTEQPFTNLCKMSKLSDMTNVQFVEAFDNSDIRNLMLSSPFVTDKLTIYEDSVGTATNTDQAITTSKEIVVSEEDLDKQFYWICTIKCEYPSGIFTVAVSNQDGSNEKQVEFQNRNDNFSYQNSCIKSWSDFGITTAGTYKIILSMSLSPNAILYRGNIQYRLIKMKG